MRCIFSLYAFMTIANQIWHMEEAAADALKPKPARTRKKKVADAMFEAASNVSPRPREDSKLYAN